MLLLDAIDRRWRRPWRPVVRSVPFAFRSVSSGVVLFMFEVVLLDDVVCVWSIGVVVFELEVIDPIEAVLSTDPAALVPLVPLTVVVFVPALVLKFAGAVLSEVLLPV